MVSFIKRPFVNLTKRARFILWIRILTLFLSIVFAATLANAKPSRLPVSVLKCETGKLALGLYDALKKSSSGHNGFTTMSEIKLLSQYIENQIAGTPEEILSSWNGWCSVNYNEGFNGYSDAGATAADYLANIAKDDSHNNVTVTCKPYQGYAFDYRGQLSQIGLNIILAYAYDADFGAEETQSQLTHSNNPYVPDENYKKALKSRQKFVDQFHTLISLALGLEVVTFFAMFIYYGRRKDSEKDDSNKSLWVKNIFAVLTTIIMILSFIALDLALILLTLLTNTVKKELLNFGIYLKYGIRHMVVLILWVCFAIFAFIQWAGPVWFNRKLKKQIDEPENDNLSNSDQIGDLYDFELESISAQTNPFHDKYDISRHNSLKKSFTNAHETTLRIDSESPTISREGSNVDVQTLNPFQTGDETVADATPKNHFSFVHSNPIRSMSEPRTLTRKPPPLSFSLVKQPLTRPPILSDFPKSDPILVPMSPILTSHLNEEKRDV